MATMTQALTVEFITTKDGDMEQKHFEAGEEVRIIKTWEHFYLIKDEDGHYHNVPKDTVAADA